MQADYKQTIKDVAQTPEDEIDWGGDAEESSELKMTIEATQEDWKMNETDLPTKPAGTSEETKQQHEAWETLNSEQRKSLLMNVALSSPSAPAPSSASATSSTPVPTSTATPPAKQQQVESPLKRQKVEDTNAS